MMNELLEDKLKKDILAKSVNNKLAKIHLKIKS